MKWSKEETFEFLGLYKNEPVLWESCFKKNKLLSDSKEAWKRIQLKLDLKCSVEDLKKKKDVLLAIYRSCVNRMNKYAADGKKEIKPKWYAYEMMTSFLGDASGQRNIRSSVAVPEDVERKNETMQSDREEVRAVCQILLQEGPQPTQDAGTPPRGVKKNKIPESSQGKDDDQLDQFARFVVAELRQLPKRKAAVLQQEIEARIVLSKKKRLESKESVKLQHIVEIFH